MIKIYPNLFVELSRKCVSMYIVDHSRLLQLGKLIEEIPLSVPWSAKSLQIEFSYWTSAHHRKAQEEDYPQ